MDLIRSAKRVYMRFWKDRPDIVLPVQWYFVPRDRPFLPLPGWRFWDSERDPANEGIRRATGDLDLGEDYLTDPVWTGGDDPTATVWQNGVYCGTPDQWANGAVFPGFIPEPHPPVPNPPLDCCGHGIPYCTRYFSGGGPRLVTFDAAGVGIAGDSTPFPLAGGWEMHQTLFADCWWRQQVDTGTDRFFWDFRLNYQPPLNQKKGFARLTIINVVGGVSVEYKAALPPLVPDRDPYSEFLTLPRTFMGTGASGWPGTVTLRGGH